MDKQYLKSIKQHLQSEEVQERIRQNILRCSSQITVSIGEVVKLLELGENQLRKWETRGLLQPQKIGNHRHYSVQDLEKLIIISELIHNKYPPRMIPADIDSIWHSISRQANTQSQQKSQELGTAINNSERAHLSINQRIEHARKDLFWRYYVSHAMRLALSLICEHLPPDNDAGLIMPLYPDPITISTIQHLEDLPKIGESLIGWLAQNGSFHTLLSVRPSFDHINDYRMYQMQEMEDSTTKRVVLEDNLLILIDGRLQLPVIESVTIDTIRRILTPISEDREASQLCFGQGTRDVLAPATHFDNEEDYILTGLANMVVRLGPANKQKRWQFCCILLPDNNALPLQQRSLIVRAQSEHSPHHIGATNVVPNETTVSVSLRAYQSGQVIYRSEVYEEDTTIAYRELENPGSVIAVPTGGENGAPIAVIYVVSHDTHAFAIEDQRMLRLLGKTVEEAIHMYDIREQTSIKLLDAILYPEVTDTFFAQETENAFVEDIENLLSGIQMNKIYDEEIAFATPEEILLDFEQTIGLSVIAIDIDKQSQLANIYGEQFTHNLVKVVSTHLKPEILRVFVDSSRYNFYYVCADRFYLVIKNLALDEACKNADRIRRRMNSSFEVSILYPMRQENKFVGPDESQLVKISVHIGVCFYEYKKLYTLLKRYPADSSVGRVRSLINRDIDISLDNGRIEKGDVVIFWNTEEHKFIRWSS